MEGFEVLNMEDAELGIAASYWKLFDWYKEWRSYYEEEVKNVKNQSVMRYCYLTQSRI